MKAIQHALDPAGLQAGHIAHLWWLTLPACAIAPSAQWPSTSVLMICRILIECFAGATERRPRMSDDQRKAAIGSMSIAASFAPLVE